MVVQLVQTPASLVEIGIITHISQYWFDLVISNTLSKYKHWSSTYYFQFSLILKIQLIRTFGLKEASLQLLLIISKGLREDYNSSIHRHQMITISFTKHILADLMSSNFYITFNSTFPVRTICLQRKTMNGAMTFSKLPIAGQKLRCRWGKSGDRWTHFEVDTHIAAHREYEFNWMIL